MHFFMTHLLISTPAILHFDELTAAKEMRPLKGKLLRNVKATRYAAVEASSFFRAA
jgi:hypothetical protein